MSFDRFVETMSGKHTLHGTVGIAYKVIPEKESENAAKTTTAQITEENQQTLVNDANKVNSTTEIIKKKKRRRTYEPSGLRIEPYRKRPKLHTDELLPQDHIKR